MPGNVICRAGTALPDQDFKSYYNPKKRQLEDRNWASEVKPVSRILTGLLQNAGTWETYTDHLIPEFTPISFQGNAGSCVANAWSDMMEILDGLVGTDKVEQLSRRWLYWVSRYLHGAINVDDGTYLHAAGHQLKTLGIFEEKYFPYYDGSEYITGDKASPELDHYTMASNNRLTGFYKAEAWNPEQYLKELEIAIRGNHPVVFGTPVNKDFQAYRGGGQVFGPPKDNILGGHAMIIVGVGYDGTTRWWLLRNSWGAGWGDKGHVKVNDDYVLSFRDVWIGTKMQELI
jgi:C1A family cysteine protease